MSVTLSSPLKCFDFLDVDALTVANAWIEQLIGLDKDLRFADVDNPENDAVFMMLVVKNTQGPTSERCVVIWYNGEDHYFANCTGRLTTKDKVAIDGMLKGIKFRD
jgi:hypothetical protein